MGATVVHLITTLTHGGAERTLAQVVPDRGVGPDGTRHLVVCLRSGGMFADRLAARGVPMSSLRMRSGLSALAGWWRLVRLLRRERPTLLLTWLYHADLLGTLAAPFAGSPRLVWNVRGTVKQGDGLPWHTRVTVRLLARLSRRPWAVAINSLAGRKDHGRVGYRPRRWILLPNGFDTDVWRPDADDRAQVRSELGVADDEVAVVMVARVHPQKDHPSLFAAMSHLIGSSEPTDAQRPPPVRLVLIGAGTEGLAPPGAVAGRTRALGVRDDVPRLLRGCDLAVLSSAFGEGMPNFVGEAMASGLPCVVTDVGDAAELVGDTGRIVPPRRPDALAQALEELIMAGSVERRRLGTAARLRVIRRWGLPPSMDAYQRLWEQSGTGSAARPDTRR